MKRPTNLKIKQKAKTITTEEIIRQNPRYTLPLSDRVISFIIES